MGSQLKCSNSQTAKRSPLGLFNDVVSTGCLESSWRHAMFVMWPKSGDWPDVNTWRPIARLKIKDEIFVNVAPAAHCLHRQQSITEVDSFRCRWACLPGCLRRCVPALVLSLCPPPWACLPPRLQSCPQAGLGCCVNCSGFFPTCLLSWIFFHTVWDVAFAFLGFPPSFSSVLSPILSGMPCPPCCPSACLRHLSLSLSPVLCPSSGLVFHFVFHLRCSVPGLIPCRSEMLCRPLVSGLVSHLCSQLV